MQATRFYLSRIDPLFFLVLALWVLAAGCGKTVQPETDYDVLDLQEPTGEEDVTDVFEEEVMDVVAEEAISDPEPEIEDQHEQVEDPSDEAEVVDEPETIDAIDELEEEGWRKRVRRLRSNRI